MDGELANVVEPQIFKPDRAVWLTVAAMAAIAVAITLLQFAFWSGKENPSLCHGDPGCDCPHGQAEPTPQAPTATN